MPCALQPAEVSSVSYELSAQAMAMHGTLGMSLQQYLSICLCCDATHPTSTTWTEHNTPAWASKGQPLLKLSRCLCVSVRRLQGYDLARVITSEREPRMVRGRALGRRSCKAALQQMCRVHLLSLCAASALHLV